MNGWEVVSNVQGQTVSEANIVREVTRAQRIRPNVALKCEHAPHCIGERIHLSLHIAAQKSQLLDQLLVVALLLPSGVPVPRLLPPPLPPGSKDVLFPRIVVCLLPSQRPNLELLVLAFL